MRFAILKEQMRAKLALIKETIDLLEQQLNFVNDGNSYSNKELFNVKNWLDVQNMELEEMHELACKYKEEFCECGSGLIPSEVSEEEELACKDCFVSPVLESSGL